MFLTHRAAQAEYFDSERPQDEIAEFYRELGRVNRLFAFAHPFQWFIPRMLGRPAVQKLSILDLGAGDGSLGEALASWAARQRWNWNIASLDNRAGALSLGGTKWKVVGSALALPFRNDSFDVVIASQMTHHFSDAETQLHLKEAWRVARLGILISDLYRNAFLYGLLWLLFQVRSQPETLRQDGLLSVRRAWRVGELRALAQAAGIRQAKVHSYFGARVLLRALKPAERS